MKRFAIIAALLVGSCASHEPVSHRVDATASNKQPSPPTSPSVAEAPQTASPTPPAVVEVSLATAPALKPIEVPDLSKTPGKSRTDINEIRICEIKWGTDERHVSDAMKRQAFEAYGYSGYDDPRCMSDNPRRSCEIDHLISRELGGADDVANLWPQAYQSSPWNATMKDKLENRLHKEVCVTHSITLKQARELIVNDWREAYVKYYGRP